MGITINREGTLNEFVTNSPTNMTNNTGGPIRYRMVPSSDADIQHLPSGETDLVPPGMRVEVLDPFSDSTQSILLEDQESVDAGDKGWSPVLAVQNNNAARVLQVVDWVGGEGTKPSTGKYIGASGLVDDINDAMNIRGDTGPKGDKGDQGDPGEDGDSGGGGLTPLKFTNYVHIEDFKDLGNYGTVALNGTVTTEDCKQALDAALAAISTAGAKGRKLMLDGCVYPTSPLADVVGGQNLWAIEGQSTRGTIIRLRPNSDNHLLECIEGIDGANVAYPEISHLTFDGNRDQQSSLGDWDCFRINLSKTTSNDPGFVVHHARFYNACRDGLFMRGRGDHRIMYNDFNRCARNGIRIEWIADTKFFGNIISACGESGFYAETLAGCTMGWNKIYFTGYNTRAGISQADSTAGKQERRRKGSAYYFEYASRLLSIGDEAEDTMGNGWTFERAENVTYKGPIFNSPGTQGRDYTATNSGGQYSNLTQPSLEMNNSDSGVVMFEFTGPATNNFTVEGGIISSAAPTADRYGQWVRSAVYFGTTATTLRSSRRYNLDFEIRGSHPSNSNFMLPMDEAKVVRVSLTSAAWVSGNTVRLTGPYMPSIGKQLGQTITLFGNTGFPSALTGTFTITAQNNGLTTMDITVPAVSSNASDYTGGFVGDVTCYNHWQAPLIIETGNYSQRWDRARLKWWNRDVGAWADLDQKDAFNGTINSLSSRIGFTTRPRQTRTITAAAYQSGGNTSFTLDAVSAISQGRGAAVNISGVSAALNGTYSSDTISSGSTYVDVEIPDNFSSANDATGLSGTLLIPYDSSFKTVDGNKDNPLITLYGKSIDSSNKVVVTFHKFREADGTISSNTKTVNITETGQEVVIYWDGGAWSIVQPTKRTYWANPSSASFVSSSNHTVRITGASDGSATLNAGLFEGHRVTISVYQASSGDLNLTVTDLLGGSSTANITTGNHVYEWSKWDGTNFKWLKVT